MLSTEGKLHRLVLPVSIAGLPGKSAKVWVPPPLYDSGPSRASDCSRSLAPPPHVVSLLRLLPPEVVPTQLSSESPVTIEFCSVIVPAKRLSALPSDAWFALKVLLVIVTVGGFPGSATVTR